MRFPRFLFNSKARLFYRLWRSERRANTHLRAELLEWQTRVLEQARVRPLFQPPPKPVEPQIQPPIGGTAKKAFLAANQSVNKVPTTEDILLQAEKANGNR